jgi:hypothetical protein
MLQILCSLGPALDMVFPVVCQAFLNTSLAHQSRATTLLLFPPPLLLPLLLLVG